MHSLLSLLGMALILLVAVLLSADRAAIRPRVVGAAFALQAGLAGLVLGEFRRMAGTSAADGDRVEPDAPRLTERETEILRLVAKGLTSRQIADKLVISYRTVQNHTQNVLGKLQLHNRVELARYAIEQGLDGGPAPQE
jgi:DNA-binding NarL/FixJ family response regulator